MSGLSTDDRNYLTAGGYGFIIADGASNFGTEWVTQLFYRANLFSGTFYLTANYQFVVNPVFNQDREPVHVIGFRAHIKF